ncbi:biotin-[acetyl-CoA-carboxylase] ligase [Rhodotorula toruloides]|uniref:Biotin-[acetyl-CoA-carboxylase] ligase n=1 Tax=Rhodotorula toruloides TaxID=5286 RepID=A0A511KCG2_RHOTO|nr:biotin-[acetyl-CoA-carboxylase] ligase [Rhodotorula toruloides]
MAKLNVLVYDGSGVSAASRDNLVRCLRLFLGQRYDVQLVTPKTIKSEPWTNNCALFVLPGGRDLPYLHDLGGTGNKRIREWVEEGGSYMGICAGAYYACSSIAFEVGTPLEVAGDRELAFFDGVCRGTIFPGFTYDSDAGARQVAMEINRNAWRDHWPQSPERCEVWYNGGGAFIPARRLAHDAEKPSTDAVVLATYSDLDDSLAAGVLCPVGHGRALLWGTHPEHPAELTGDTAVDTAKERDRLGLIRASLSALGLEVADAPQAIPRLHPLYLASVDQHLLQRTAEALATAAKPYGPGRALFEDRNDNFVLYDASAAPRLLHEARHPVDATATDEVDLTAVEKDVCVFDEGLPGRELSPLFDFHLFFSRLGAGHGTHQFGRILMYSEVVTSTQTMLDKNDAFLSKLPDGLACVASHQVAGRGRGGNTWISPAGCLQFSLVARLPASASAKIVFMQYLFGLAVVEAIRGAPGYEDLGLRLKWPNDIYADLGMTAVTQGQDRYRKIGGILVNSSFSGGTFSLIVGCGINTSNPRPTTSVNDLIDLSNRHRGTNLAFFRPETLLALIFDKFSEMWPTFVQSGFEPFTDRYLSAWIHSDQIVTLDSTSQRVRILGITPDHGLLRTVPLNDHGYEDYLQSTTASSLQRFIDLQPDGNRFDILKGLIYAKSA